MRRRDPVRIGDALNDFFSSTPVIARKIAEAKIPDLWPVLVGNVIASYTTKIELRTGGRLFVHLSSSVARNEVFMRRSALMDAINEASGIRIVSSSSNSFPPAHKTPCPSAPVPRRAVGALPR